jgi:O-antigen ligase
MKLIYFLPGILYFMLFPNFVDGVEFPRLIALTILLLILVVFKSNFLIIKNKTLLISFALPIFMLLSTIANDQNILGGFFGKQGRNFGILLYLCLAILFIASSNIENKDSKKFFLYALFPISLFSIAYGLIQLTNNDFLKWGESDRIVLSVGNSNFAAGYLALLIPASLYAFFKYGNPIIKLFFSFLLLGILILGMKTISFQFYVLSFVAVFSFLFVYNVERIRTVSKTVKGLVFIAFATMFSTIIYFNRNVFDEFTNAADRLAQQRAGLEIFRDHLGFGVGPDNLNRYMPQYLTVSDVRREGYYNNPDRTHNSLIDILANSGLFAGISYLVFIAYILLLIKRLISANKIAKLDIALPSAIYITYLVQGFINTDSILNMIVPYISMGLIVSLYQYSTSVKSIASKEVQQPIKLSLIVVLVLTCLIAPKAVMSELETKKILSGTQISQDQVLHAVNLWPDRENIEKILILIAQNVSNCPVTTKVADRLLDVDDRSAQSWYVKALCVDATGDIRTAREFVTKALEFQPLNPIYLTAMIQLEKALGLLDEAENSQKILDSLGVIS